MFGVAAGGEIASEAHGDGAGGDLGEAGEDDDVGGGDGSGEAGGEGEGDGETVGEADDDVADGFGGLEVGLLVGDAGDVMHGGSVEQAWVEAGIGTGLPGANIYVGPERLSGGMPVCISNGVPVR